MRGHIQLSGKGYNTVRIARPGVPQAQFGPAEIQSYGTKGRSMKVSKVSGTGATPQFMLPLVEGYVSLYRGENAQGQKRYFLQQPGGAQLTEIEPLNNQLTLARALSGCATLDFGTDEFQRRYRYTTEGMTRLVMDYNTCRQPTQPSTVSRRPSGVRASLGLKAGVNVSRFDVQAQAYAGLGQQRDALGYQAGAMLNIATLTPFSVQMEATYMTLNSSYGPYEAYAGNIGYPSNTHSLRIKYSQVQVPVLLRYSFGHGMLRPYLNAGPTVGFNFKNSSADTYPSTSTGLIAEPVQLGKSALGFAAGAGLTINNAPLPGLSLEIRYDRLGESTGSTEYFSNLNRHSSLRFEVGISL